MAEITKEILLKKKAEYLQVAEQAKLDSIANAGAADAMDELIKEFYNPKE
jgi:hypothetical protein